MKGEQAMEAVFESASRYKFVRREDWPVDIGIAGGCILGYVFAWIGLAAYFHPAHWVAGVIGSLAGCLVGWAWYWIARKDA
jgi:hypothetical protein